jgi:hypothetical protein
VKPEKQRIAIAEACGHEIAYGEIVTIEPRDDGSPTIVDHRPIPDYLNDLNAMNEAEKVLTNDDADSGSQWSYVQQLIDITKAESMEMHREVFIVSTATAAQRAEAFLRTLGKWEDAK